MSELKHSHSHAISRSHLGIGRAVRRVDEAGEVVVSSLPIADQEVLVGGTRGREVERRRLGGIDRL